MEVHSKIKLLHHFVWPETHTDLNNCISAIKRYFQIIPPNFFLEFHIYSLLLATLSLFSIEIWSSMDKYFVDNFTVYVEVCGKRAGFTFFTDFKNQKYFNYDHLSAKQLIGSSYFVVFNKKYRKNKKFNWHSLLSQLFGSSGKRNFNRKCMYSMIESVTIAWKK